MTATIMELKVKAEEPEQEQQKELEKAQAKLTEMAESADVEKHKVERELTKTPEHCISLE